MPCTFMERSTRRTRQKIEVGTPGADFAPPRIPRSALAPSRPCHSPRAPRTRGRICPTRFPSSRRRTSSSPQQPPSSPDAPLGTDGSGCSDFEHQATPLFAAAPTFCFSFSSTFREKNYHSRCGRPTRRSWRSWRSWRRAFAYLLQRRARFKRMPQWIRKLSAEPSSCLARRDALTSTRI